MGRDHDSNYRVQGWKQNPTIYRLIFTSSGSAVPRRFRASACESARHQYCKTLAHSFSPLDSSILAAKEWSRSLVAIVAVVAVLSDCSSTSLSILALRVLGLRPKLLSTSPFHERLELSSWFKFSYGIGIDSTLTVADSLTCGIPGLAFTGLTRIYEALQLHCTGRKFTFHACLSSVLYLSPYYDLLQLVPCLASLTCESTLSAVRSSVAIT